MNQTQRAVSYAELHERVSTQVNAYYPHQRPQCEGDRDRELFGGRTIHRDPFITVDKVEDNTVMSGWNWNLYAQERTLNLWIRYSVEPYRKIISLQLKRG